MRVYLAGPDVFLPDARGIGRRKMDLCRRYGHEGLFPLESEIDPAAAGASLRIFRSNQAMMDGADAIIANLTPFRGPSADAGTVYELGYMAGRGKICLGYSNIPGDYAGRVARGSIDGEPVDGNGHVIEEFGQSDNLMIVHALETCGRPLLTPQAVPADIWADLSLFESCLPLLSEFAAHDRLHRAR